MRLAVILLLYLAIFAAGCRKTAPVSVAASEPPAVAVAVVKIEPQAFAATIPITGTLVSKSRVDVKAETIGRVTRFDKHEGESVRAGEAVVWIEDENYKLAAQQTESAVQVAEAAVERTRVVEAHSRSEMERAQNLLRSGGITEKDLKAALLAEKDARAQTALAEAQLAQARASLAVARKRLRDCVIHAPVSGEIQKRHVNPGAYVEAPTALFTLVDNGKLELESSIAASDLAPVRAGQNVSFAVNSYPGAKFAGWVEEISPAVETETRAAKTRIRVNNSSRKLKAGMFAEGEILTGLQSHVLVVPASAIHRDDRSVSEAFVFVVENGKAVKRSVRVAGGRDSKVQIASGLKAGELLVAEQSIEVAEGVRIAAR